MKFGKFSLAIMLLGIAVPSFGQADPDPDGLGIYLDQGATVNSAVVAEGTSTVAAYLILTNPSLEGNLDFWNCYVSTYLDDPNDGTTIFGGPVNGQNLIVSNMPGSFSWSFRVGVYGDPPLIATPVTVLANLEILMYEFDRPIYLYVRGVEVEGVVEEVGYSVGSEGAFFHPSSGSWDLPVAVINGEAPVATESFQWDQLKLLFR